ncbi:MAG: leucine-rich repeat domain-containing protein [Bacteroidales bacterium]|nr:leucine-rich repeat domain-containing protein [Bacteroidales bacterium]
MKTLHYLLIASSLLLSSCASEELILTGTTVENVTYSLDNDRHTAQATGYLVKGGSLSPVLSIPDAIEAVNLHYTVTSVADAAFVYGNWETVEIAASVLSIGSRAFIGCDHLTLIVLQGDIAPTIASDTFSPDTYLTATLVVPRTCDLTSTPWAQFTSIIHL